ncbi:hypothetical protein ACF0HX_02315 [Pediococcus pentosaceus]
MIEFCQQLEWYRYTNQIKRSKKVFVLTGTASMVSAEMFQKVKARKGSFYDEDSITEDFALTIDLKEAGPESFPQSLVTARRKLCPTGDYYFYNGDAGI